MSPTWVEQQTTASRTLILIYTFDSLRAPNLLVIWSHQVVQMTQGHLLYVVHGWFSSHFHQLRTRWCIYNSPSTRPKQRHYKCIEEWIITKSFHVFQNLETIGRRMEIKAFLNFLFFFYCWLVSLSNLRIHRDKTSQNRKLELTQMSRQKQKEACLRDCYQYLSRYDYNRWYIN